MKLKSYESPTLYLLELCTADVISDSPNGGDSGSEEPENTNPVYGPVDGGSL